MAVFKKTVIAVAILFVTFGAEAQLNGTYWASHGKGFTFNDGRYEYFYIIPYPHSDVVWHSDTLTCGDYEILDGGKIVKFDTNPLAYEIWQSHVEIIVQVSPTVPSDSVEIVFEFPLLDSIPLAVTTRSGGDNYKTETIVYDKNKKNSIVMPNPKSRMNIDYWLPSNGYPVRLDDWEASAEFYVSHRDIVVSKPNNRVIIRNEKDSDKIFNRVLHQGEYGIISGDTITYKNMKYVKRDRKLTWPKGHKE